MPQLTTDEIFQWINFGIDNPQFTYEDWQTILKIARLAKAHQRQCENSCNGVGIVKGVAYTTGEARGAYQKSAYIDEETTVFDREIKKLENKIFETYFDFRKTGKEQKWKVEFQHDPRGNTVKLTINGQYVPLR